MHLFKSSALALACCTLPVAGFAAVDLECSTARVLVGFPPGGGTDFQARVVVDAINEVSDGVHLQVVNLSGQSGNRAAREVIDAAPDGCTLFFHHAALLSSYLTGRTETSWDAFAPVAMVSFEPAIYAASRNDNFNSLSELVDYASAHPGEITAAVSVGSDSHFFALQLQDLLDVELNLVGYNGEAERVTAMLSNVIQFAQVTEQTASQYLGNELVPLTYAYTERSDSLPDVPTAREAGYDFVVGTTRGLLMPKDTPAEIVDHYAQLIEQAMQSEEVKAAFERTGTIVDYRAPAEYTAWWQETAAAWEELAIKLGIFQPRG
ncbi:Bug family tripartite tricarboxylate transporter substrate binding protein [Pararhodobacter oceanensis]|uniref:Bug family tripartite tricarboxylate transporter substrate binding protein n=1 Tax=Pararhodobacter oceanensis TaxID=2172121 RepID=UPI003A8E7BC5